MTGPQRKHDGPVRGLVYAAPVIVGFWVLVGVAVLIVRAVA